MTVASPLLYFYLLYALYVSLPVRLSVCVGMQFPLVSLFAALYRAFIAVLS